MKMGKREKRKRENNSWLSGLGGIFGPSECAGAWASRVRQPTSERTVQAGTGTMPWARAHVPARGRGKQR
jgi:hypothetical protein